MHLKIKDAADKLAERTACRIPDGKVTIVFGGEDS